MKRRKICKTVIAILFIICVISCFLCTSFRARWALSTFFTISENFASDSSKDICDLSTDNKLIVSNKSTIHSLNEMLDACKCERIPWIQQSLPTTSMSPSYYVGSHYIGVDVSFVYTFFCFQYDFVLQSDDYLQWRNYIDGVIVGTSDSGFILE